MSYSYYGFAPYVSVASKKAKALKKLAQLKKKNPGIAPLTVEGNKLAHTWWGKAWNSNLEKYADYSNRIGRGRSYIRNGFVLDFKIKPGQVSSLVHGSGSQPYQISIKIQPLKKAAAEKIRQQCEGQIESLQELIEGRFPKQLAEIFTAKGQGLFPTPQEIHFNCSCPDSASMCKHIAATLYGVGVKLDQDPKLFFHLRQTNLSDLITQAIKGKSEKMLKQAEKKTSRVITDLDTASIFGIDMDEKVVATKPSPVPTKKVKQGKKVRQSAKIDKPKKTGKK
jgi:uncharacterized Zn finger protein